jgi:hypothetical protein
MSIEKIRPELDGGSVPVPKVLYDKRAVMSNGGTASALGQSSRGSES